MSEIKNPPNPSNYLPLKLSKKDFLQYKEKLEKFLSIRREEYKNLFESFDILKQKKFHLSFLLFSYYNSWVFPYISYNKITRGNIFSSTFEISFIFKKLSKDMNCPFDEKLFILWYFYIYYNFFIKEKKNKPNALINQMRYLLLETGKIVINLLEKKYLSIESVINILDVNLLCLEFFIDNPEFTNLQKKYQKTSKLIFFLNFFHLLKEVSVLTLKQNKGFDLILTFLDKLCLHSELKDEINIIMLFNNNILQNFMQSLLDNINVVELKKTVPNYKQKLIDFYSHFLINKYKVSNLFNFLVDTLRNSFEHLYNFKQNKNLIIRDIFKNNFNSNLLSKLHNNTNSESTSPQNIDDIKQLNSSFYFDSKTSSISFENTKKISLDQVILFFSFRFDDTDSTELPLFLILNTNKKKEKIIALKIFLKKAENDSYKLYIAQQKNDNVIILNEDSDLVISKNQNFFCGIYLNEKKMSIFLHSLKIHKMDETSKIEIGFNPIPKDENLLFYLGKDEKDNNFYKGKMGPFIIIKAPKLDNKANKDIEKFIGEILCLCENYKDFLIKKSELSKYYDLNLKDFFWQKYFDDSKKMDKIKGNFDCLFYLNPENFKFYKNSMLEDESCINSENKSIPLFYEYGNQNLDFNITYFNVTVLYDEMFIKLFMTDNGIYYFCLLFEYYNQFLRYYLLKNDKQKGKEKIFEENEIKDIMKDIIESIIKYILMLGNQSYSKYAYNSSKKIWNYIYSCILNLNKISPIINEFIPVLIISKDLNKDVLLTHKNRLEKHEKGSISNDSKNKIEKDKNNNFIDFNKSYFIGINEILLTPDLYKNNKDIIKLIETVFNSVFKGINDVIDLLDLPLVENIFYKLLNFILVLKEYFMKEKKEENEIIINEEKKEIKEDDKFKQILENIFRLIIEFLNRKTDTGNINLSKEFFNKLFLFVFEYNKKEYNIILSYLNIINEISKTNKSIMLNGNQILQLKYFLLESGKYKGKEDNNEDIIYDKLKQKIQNLIIVKIYEYLFTTDNKNSVYIQMNFLDEYLQKNKLTKDLFHHIEKLLERNFIDFFKEQDDVNTPNSPLTLKELNLLNIYFENIFEFLKYLLKLLRKKDLIEENDSIKYLNIIYDIIFKSQNSIKIEADNNIQRNIEYIVYLLNFIEFLHSSLYNNELNFLFQESKILEIIEELFDKCNQLTLIHCEFYFKLKDEENSSEENTENKLISEIFIDIYKSRLQKIYDDYRLPGNSDKEVEKNDLDFIKKFNSLLDKKFISEFNLETYDIKKSSNIQKSKSIFFDSDFLKLTLGKKYSKKFSKVKEISPKMKLYNLMNGIITLLKPDFIDFSNKFEFYHTTYHFYEAYDLCNIMVQSYSNDEEIKKHEDLKQSLEETNSALMKFKKLLLDDHLKLNLIYKDFFTKSGQTNESKLKNMLKSIQSILFNKKYKNIDPNALINNIENEFSNYESKSEKPISSNSKGSNNSYGSNPGQKNITTSGSKDSFEGNQNKNLELLFPPEIFGDVSKLIIVNDNNINDKGDNKDNDSFEQIEIEESGETQSNILVKSIINSPTKNILDKLDKHSILNPKKELMKTIFGTYFSKSFFENESFKKLKTKFLNSFHTPNPDTKLLNYPSKNKNFINGLHPPLFLKENNKFFISKIFPITHDYYYDYMHKNNLLNDSIILLKPTLSLEKNINSNFKKFNCELIKSDRIYYGEIKFWKNEKFFYFARDDFEIFNDKKEIKITINELNERGFSYSSLKYLETEAAKKANINAKNDYLDQDIFPKMDFNFNKKVIIFYDDIEEVVEKRILFIWQGFEIFLKNGKSYMFNLLTKKNYEDIIKILKENNKSILFREKDFIQNTQDISQIWRDKKLDTYEYLLYLNKFSSRSFNDMSQYYIFPWILRDFSHLVEINSKEKELYEYRLKHDKDKDTDDDSEDNNHQKSKKKDNKEIIELLKNFRDLKYPVSAQEKKHRLVKKEKFNDEEEKFQSHHGTHYATGSYVEYFLMRIEPFTSLLVELQNYSQEDPNRLLLRLKDTITIINTGYDNRELVPEMYSKIDFFININCAFFGFKKSSELVDDISNMWETENAQKNNMLTIYSEFILAHRKLLNSNIISSRINIWIDNIFGYNQIPSAKKIENSINIFPKSSYEQYVDLHKKLEKLLTKYEGKNDKILRKFINKINVITSFGQCPYQIFTEKHKSRESPKENDAKLEEVEEVNNYGMQSTYLGKDFIDTYIIEELKNDNTSLNINPAGIYFEVAPLIDKIFILTDSNKLTIIDTNFYCLSSPKKYNWVIFNEIELSSIYLFDKIQTAKNNNYYIYNIKYAFSSFHSDINNSSLNLYANEYLNSMQYNYENKYEKIKFITCRHLDNSFKIHFATLKKKKKPEILTSSFICEDFVMCCKTISDKSFIIGLKNGKLIKAILNESDMYIDKNNKKHIKKYGVIFENYITGHLGSINVIEIDKKNGIVITGGDDNKIFIRKLYDFELLTSIELKEKYIITMIKISPTNLLYVMCFNRILGKFVIFGYSLSGLKFAKSDYSFYKNISFTKNGNIISLTDDSEIKILYGHNLKEIIINESDKDYKKFNNVKKSFNSGSATIGWMQFDDFKNYYGFDRSVVSYISKEPSKKDYSYSFQTLKVTNISYFE